MLMINIKDTDLELEDKILDYLDQELGLSKNDYSLKFYGFEHQGKEGYQGVNVDIHDIIGDNLDGYTYIEIS